jgi:predicted nucleotidyltransferase
VALFEPIFRALNDAGVRYVVVGGVAVVLQGHPRLTADLDIAVDLSPGEAARAIDALVGIGLKPRAPVDPSGFADAATRRSWVEQRGMQVFGMADPADPMREVDLFVDEPIPFAELFEHADTVDVAGTRVRVASIPDLIELKRSAGRSQDEEDIAALEQILRERGDG